MRHVLLTLAIGAALAALTTLITNEFYLRILFNIGVYYLCAAGMNVLLGYAGQKSLGQAGLVAAGAYAVAILTTRYALDPWLSLLAAMLVAALCGVLIALPSLKVKGPSLAMVTLAFGVVVEKVVVEFTDLFGGAMGIYAIQPLYGPTQPFTMFQWVLFVIALGVATHLLMRNLLCGRFGRAFLSLQADEVAAGSVGVQVYGYKVIAFVIAAVTCGLAGALIAQQNQYFNSDFVSFHLSIFIMLMVLFGGAGSLYGPLLGSVVLVCLGAILARWSWLEHFVNGALLLFALYVMPRGLAGVLSDLAARFREKPAVGEGVAPASELVPFTVRRSGEAPGPETALLVAEGIGKAYGGVVPARNVGFTLKSGHIHALIGPNGAGKTTMINMLSGIVRPDSGSITFRGTPLVGLGVDDICERGLARTFQNLRLFKDLSVLDNVLLGQHRRMGNGFWSSLLALPKARREEAKALAHGRAVLAFLGLAAYADAPAGSLPYGLQRRVELARALATEPWLLLLDEPAAGLNPRETAELGELLQRIRDRGVTILLVEHHMDLVMAISDHVIVLDYGEKIAEGTPAAVQSNPRVMAAYLGTDEEAVDDAVA